LRTWNRLQSHNSAAPYACQQWRNSVRRWPMPLPSSGRRICVCLEVLLAAELEERERNTIAHRIKDARLPRMKTLEEFDFSKAPQVPATKMHDLAQGGYIERAEPVILIGATGLCLAACRQKRRVRFTTAAALVNELVEAKQQLQLHRVLARWERYDAIAIDEVGYVPMAELGAEFLFQVIAERAEKAAVILTPICRSPSGLRSYPTPASARRSWTRITDRAHVVETGADSFRFRRTVEKGRPKPTGRSTPALYFGLPLRSSPKHSASPSQQAVQAICHRWARLNCHKWAKKTCQTHGYVAAPEACVPYLYPN